MPGYWGQYGPKTRSAEFLNYDRANTPAEYELFDPLGLDRTYASEARNSINYSSGDVFIVNYTFTSYPNDVNFPPPGEDLIIPFCPIKSGQTILSIERNYLFASTPCAASDEEIAKCGYWLYSANLRSAWNKRLASLPPKSYVPTSLEQNPTYFESPQGLEDKTYMDAGVAHFIDYYKDDYNFCAVDATSTIPPFIASTTIDRNPSDQDGFYLCLCLTNAVLGAGGDFHIRTKVTVRNGGVS